MKSDLLIKILLLTVCSISFVQASESENSGQTRTRFFGKTPQVTQKKSAPFLNQKQSISDSFGANDTLNQVFDQDSTGMKDRLEKVRNARKLNEKGEIIQEYSNMIGDTLNTVGGFAPESNPYTNAAGSALKVTGSVIQTLGKIVGGIIQGVARYKGIQLIQSTDEQLVRGIEDSFAKIEYYSEALEELSTKRITLKTGNSLTDRFKNAFRPSAWKGSVQDLLDKTYLTDFKGQRLEEARPIQLALKLEKENFEDLVRLLQIKLIEQVIKIKMAELHPDQTQFQVERDLATLQEAKKQTIQKVSQMDPVKNKTQRAQLMLTLKDLDQKVRTKQTELDKLLSTHLTQEQITQLEEEIALLRKEIKPIYELTRLYKGQKTEEKQTCCPEEFRALQEQLDSLKKEVDTLKNLTQKQTTQFQNGNRPRPMGMTQDSNQQKSSFGRPTPHTTQPQQPNPSPKTPYRWQPPQQKQTTF